ncbi:MAG TPA: ATP-binding cassette domain-containing protein [Thermoanaerobaculia bacterium]|nr:ATP-binding cassette domain-containing protein [Thermoanaerobaculia bacterium]
MEQQNAIVVDRISKKYGDFTAVEDVSFNVRKGSIFGLLGPNGAGKTTTIRMIMNIIAPDSGTISILGASSTERASELVGYLPEERGLYKKMKVLDHLIFLGEIRGLDRATSKTRSQQWLERLSLADWSNRRVEELSKGMQQKVQFIGSVIHEPPVMILDEPFSGLDPVNARVLKQLFVEFRAAGKTLVLSTHVMEHAEQLCDEVALVNNARIVLRGSIAEVKRQYSGNRLEIRGNGDLESIRQIPEVFSVESRDGGAAIELKGDASLSDFLRKLTSLYALESVVPHEASLDEIFVKVVGTEHTEGVTV